MFNINYRDPRPIYEQIVDGYRKLIASGSMKEDEKMPSVRALASSFAINPNTIAKAYSQLEAEGYIYSVAGRGSYVSSVNKANEGRKKELLASAKKLIEELRLMGASEDELKTLIDK